MSRRYFIKTFGCQMNEYDSARMADVLRAGADLVATDDPLEADLLLMNTCSVREKAQDKVFSLLGEWRLLKARRPQVIIGVGGCVASQEGAGITERAPFVDLVFGPQTLHRLPQMLDELRRTGKPVVDVSFPEIEKFDRLPAPRAEGARAFVSIMEGCSKYCSFCIVPYTRGEEVSRCFDSEEHTSELQSPCNLVCRLLLEKKIIFTDMQLVSFLQLLCIKILILLISQNIKIPVLDRDSAKYCFVSKHCPSSTRV